MTNLPSKIIGLRIAKGLSRTQLAKLVPMHRSYLCQIEQGTHSNLGREKLRGLAKALDVSIDYLDSDDIVETRSWEKVAVDKSLEQFLSRSDLAQEEKEGLRRASFTQGAPRSVKKWEEWLDAFRAYSQPKGFGKQSKNRPRSRKNVNPGNSLTSLPIADTGE